MPTAISASSNSSYYDPNAQFTAAQGADAASAASGSSPQASQPEVVTISPVVITGDAGARGLVERYDAASRTPSCSLEAKSAALSCAKVGIAAAGGILMSSTGIGAAVGLAATLAESVTCGKDLRAYSDCRDQ